MQYVILILIIFSLQISFFTNFKQLEQGSYFDKKMISALTKKNQELQAQMESQDSLSGQGSRNVASVVGGVLAQKTIDMGSFYYSQYEYYLSKKDNHEALESLNKIKEKSLDPVLVPKSVYSKIQLKCQKQLSPDCVDEVDFLVQQFPDSEWTGLSMSWLAQYYVKMNRPKEAQALKLIIDKEFSKKWNKM